MLVISDTSPLNYLILIDAVDVLPTMYQRIAIPTAVADELSAPGTPTKTKLWFANRPSWLEVHTALNPSHYPELDAGESQAIALAKQLHANLLLVDERRATQIARELENLPTTGTLGLLLDAATLGLLNLPLTLSRLQNETTFYAPSTLYEQILQEHQRRIRS